MKIVKRLLFALFAIVILLLVAAVAIPYFYKDEIIDFAKVEINKQVDAEVDFGDVSLSLFRSFPDFSFGLADVSVIGKNEFKGVPLTTIKNFDMTLDFWSVISSSDPIQVKGINLDEPNINVQVLRNGKANYDIVAPSDTTTTESSGDFLISLDHYSISDGNLVYNDKAGDIFLEIKNLNHSGSGDLTAAVYDLNTETSIDKLTAASGGVTYLSRAKARLDAIFNIDMNTSTYTLKDNDLRINALQVKADGYVQMPNDDINMDIKFSAPSNQFKDFLSMIPGAYVEGYEDVKADGQVKFNGFVKGTFNSEKEEMPAFRIDLNVANGSVQYPDLPLGINGIQTTASINSPSSNLDKMQIDVPTFKMLLANNPLEASLKLRTPISDPDIDTKVKGLINLEDFSKTFPMEGVKTLNGLIDADFMMKARLSQLDGGDYENVNMAGDLKITNMDYVAEGLPEIIIKQMAMDFTPQFVNLKGFDALLGKSDIKASGKIDNILAYFSPEKTMKGTFSMRSDLFDANEWLTEEETTESTPTTSPDSELTNDEEIFDRFDFTADARIGKLIYDIYELDNNIAIGHFTPNKMMIDQFETKIGKSDLKGDGTITNVFNYLFDNETLGGEINIRSNYFDLNPFMVAEEEGEAKAVPIKNEEEALEPIIIPENINMVIHSNFKELIYTNMDLKNVKGDLVVANQEARIENGTMQTLGGNFDIAGGYNTQNTEKPQFDMDFALSKLDIQKAFNTFNSFQALAPIGKFIEGKFNSTLKMKGVLGKDMMPDLSTLSADGFMHTLDAIVKNFKPLEAIGQKLNMDAFKTMKIKNTKNWFEIKDGQVEVKEFPFEAKGIDMLVKGTHGLNQDMDYSIKAKIPRDLLSKTGVGNAADKGIGFLNSQASKLGVNLDVGKFINVLVSLGGSITSPKISVKPLGADGEETSIKNVVENVKETVKDTINKIKEEKIAEIKEDFSAKKKELSDEMNVKVDKILADAKKQADRAKAEAVKLADQARDKAYQEADAAADKVKNPLKKLAAKEAAKIAKNQADKVHAKAVEKAESQHASIMKNAEQRADKTRSEYQEKIDKLGS